MGALAARLLLALVFAAAGGGKLADREGARQDIVEFGLPPRLAAPLGLALPVIELVVAVALLAPVSARLGALAGLALLLIYIAGISINLALGRHPECRCFGKIFVSPIGWRALARNLILVALAAFVIWSR